MVKKMSVLDQLAEANAAAAAKKAPARKTAAAKKSAARPLSPGQKRDQLRMAGHEFDGTKHRPDCAQCALEASAPTPAEAAATAADPNPVKPARLVGPVDDDAGIRAVSNVVVEIAVNEIGVAADNPRAPFDPTAAESIDLAASVGVVGVLEPILVVPREHHVAGATYLHHTEDPAAVTNPEFVVISGHRRLEAARLAGLQTVPAIVRADLTPEGIDETRLIENLQRTDLTPLEEARAYQQLLTRGYTQTRIAERLSRNQGTISKRLSLLKLDPKVQAAVGAGLPPAAAVELAKIKDPARQRQAANDVINRGGNVEEAARVAERAQIEERKADKKAAAVAALDTAGIKVLKHPGWAWAQAKFRALAGQDVFTGYELDLTVAAHKGSPCHAAVVDDDAATIYVCTNPAAHPDADPRAKANKNADKARKSREAEQAKAEKKRAALIQARRTVVAQLVEHPPRAAEVTAHLALVAAVGAFVEFDHYLLAAELLGLPVDDADDWEVWIDTVMAHGGPIVTVGWVTALALGEHLVSRGYWSDGYLPVAHLDLLEAHGYTLTPDETEQRSRARFDITKRQGDLTPNQDDEDELGRPVDDVALNNAGKAALGGDDAPQANQEPNSGGMTPGPLPRGTCPECDADVALRKGGLVREHRVDGEVCVGAGGLSKEQISADLEGLGVGQAVQDGVRAMKAELDDEGVAAVLDTEECPVCHAHVDVDSLDDHRDAHIADGALEDA